MQSSSYAFVSEVSVRRQSVYRRADIPVFEVTARSSLMFISCRTTTVLTFLMKIISSNYYRAMHFSAKRGIAIASRLSVCPSLCL